MLENFIARLATLDDMKDVFDLSNDETVRKNSFNQDKISWEDHQAWFKNKLQDKNCLFYLFRTKKENDFCGYIRLDKEDDVWVITIHISLKYRNKGLGCEFLNEIINHNNDKKLQAFVKTENIGSYKMFLKCNFIEVEKFVLNNCEVYRMLKK